MYRGRDSTQGNNFEVRTLRLCEQNATNDL